MIHDPLFWCAIGTYGALLLVGWLAFTVWTWRIYHPAQVASNAGYVLALESAVMDLESTIMSLEAMRDLQAKANRFLTYRVSYLSQQITWLLSVQPQQAMVSI